MNSLVCKVHGGRYIPSETSTEGICGACVSVSPLTYSPKSDFKSKVVPQAGLEEKQPLNPISWGNLPKYSAFCLCTECGEVFNSLYGFDMHRMGITDRWCLDERQMRKKGMSINDVGRWITQEFDRSYI